MLVRKTSVSRCQTKKKNKVGLIFLATCVFSLSNSNVKKFAFPITNTNKHFHLFTIVFTLKRVAIDIVNVCLDALITIIQHFHKSNTTCFKKSNFQFHSL